MTLVTILGEIGLKSHKLMNKLLLVAFLVFSLDSSSQKKEAEQCAFPTNKKILKQLDKAHAPSTPAKEQYQALKDGLEIDANCAQCMLELGIRSFNINADRQSLGQSYSFEYAVKYFNDLISLCPQYHADPYYYLGIFYYGEKNNAETVKYFNLFLNYKNGNEFSYAEDHQKKVADVKEILPEIAFSETFYKNVVPFNPEVVIGVSSRSDEYLPMLSPDNEMIFYTRKRDAAAPGDIKTKIIEEFTLSLRDDISKPFDGGSPLPKPFNQGPNYGGSSISIDNKEIIICSCKDEKNGMETYRNCDLFSARYEKLKDPDSGKEHYSWSELVNLGPKINTADGWEAQPSLSADGNTLFYATIRENTQLTDIYYSVRDVKGNWSLGRSVGNTINTPGNDKTPFIHTDSKTLYFTSEVGPSRLGAGGFDIFYSRQDEKGTWSKPMNIGYPINTTEDEHGLIVSTDGKMAYFSSGKYKGTGGLDIYRFELYPEARPESVVIVKGELKDAEGNIVTDAKVEIKYASDNKIERAHIDKVDGKFYAVINTTRPQDIVITVKKEGHVFDSKLIVQTELNKPVIKHTDLVVAPIEKGKSYTLNDILFGTNSFELTAKAKFVIDQFIEFLQESPNVKIEIQGHTDNEGDPAANVTLSENRARAVMDYIIAKGLNIERITSKGYGQAKPKVPNTSVFNKAKNRRTEFFIVEM